MLRWPSVLAWRLRRQHLAERVPRERAMAVVEDVCCLHAQVASSAELTLWARVEDLGRGWVQQALERRELVKTWAMRGTLHLLPAEEAATWIGAQGALPARWEKPAWRRGFGVTQDEVDGILAAVPEALAGEPLTRADLADAVARRLGAEHLAEPEGILRLLPAFSTYVVAAPSPSRSSRSAGWATACAPPRRPRRSASPRSWTGSSTCPGRRPERTLASWGP
jgi:hypothetical protein